MAVMIAVATVYGRYHYLADATVGLWMAILVRALKTLRTPACVGTACGRMLAHASLWTDEPRSPAPLRAGTGC